MVDRVYHIDRGYENIEEKLGGLGARIRRPAVLRLAAARRLPHRMGTCAGGLSLRPRAAAPSR